MPFCKNDPKKSYKGTEPSPKGLGYCAHTENVGKIMKGLDGNKWIIAKTSQGVKRWIKYDNKKIIKKTNKKLNNNIVNSKISKNDCSKFVIYEKKYETGFFIKSIKYDIIQGLEDNQKRYVRKFITYNKFEDKYTKVPEDYKKIKINKNIINDYCGSKVLLEKNNQYYQEIKKKHIGYKSYFIHWNGGTPFCVYVKNKEVYIYNIPENVYIEDSLISYNRSDNIWMYVNLYEKYNAEKVFIGESPKNYTDDKCPGNTILLKMKNNIEE